MMKVKPKYSILLPVFNEQKNLDILYQRLSKVMDSITPDYEIIFIDDHSKDNSFEILNSFHQQDPRVKIIKFTRNFGHQIAITSGLDFAQGGAVIIMDADLQDPPEIIVQFIEKYKKGYEIVYGEREKRQGETIFKRVTAFIFYRIMQIFTNIEIPLDTGDFRLIDQKVVDSLKTMQEKNKFLRGLISWTGYKQIGVKYKRDARYAGKTNFTIRKMLRFAFDGICSFSRVPLRFASFLGFGVSVISFLMAIMAFFLKVFELAPPGWLSLMLTMLFLGGVQLVTIGIIGEYLGRIYEEVKNRPLYIVDKTVGIHEKSNT
jgi:polyisoprenyl-phosphate glycosyltransferase